MVKPIINQLNGGEISPWLEGRIDLPKYGYSAKVMRNFIPLVEGSMVRRGGSHYVSSCKEVNAVHLSIVATPSDADIYINNELAEDIYCAPGEKVTYTITLAGYQTVTGTTTVEEDTTLEISLLSQEFRNTLEIVPTPADADVYINGVKSLSATVVKGATVIYRVEKDGYDAAEGSIVVNEDTTLPISLGMSFEIIATPSDAIVTINGATVKRIPAAPGDVVSWSVSAAGYTAQSGTVTITGSEILYIDLRNIYELNQVIFEKATAGTYTLAVKTPGWYNISMCSAGGGGGGSATSHSWMGSDGCSGAAFIGKVRLEQTSYSIKVGQGGNGGSASGRNASNGQPESGNASYDAGITFIKNASNASLFNITMTPGLGGFGTGDYSSKPLTGGVISAFTNVTVQTKTLLSDGKTKSTVSLLGNGYGAGGKAVASKSGTNGTNGYVRIIYIGQA